MRTHQATTLLHMITHRVPLADAYAGFTLARNKSATKVMVLPGTRDAAEVA